jgi:hypothetical protein
VYAAYRGAAGINRAQISIRARVLDSPAAIPPTIARVRVGTGIPVLTRHSPHAVFPKTGSLSITRVVAGATLAVAAGKPLCNVGPYTDMAITAVLIRATVAVVTHRSIGEVAVDAPTRRVATVRSARIFVIAN